MRGFRMNTVQQADIDEIRANVRDRAYASAFKRSAMLLNAIVNTDSAAPPARGMRAGAMAMTAPPMLRDEDKTALDESIDKLKQECQSLSGNVETLKAERQAERERQQQEQEKTQASAARSTQQPGKQQQGKEAGKTAGTGSTPENRGGPKNEGQMTTTEGDAKTPDARRSQQNQSNAPTAKQPVASQEELAGGQESDFMASELSDEPGASTVSVDDLTALIGVIVNLWNRFRGRRTTGV